MLYHYGASGTTYLYIHLNNDLTPRNDNKGGCVKDVAFAVPDGAKVDRRPADRAGTVTRATRAATRTSTSRCTRTTAATSNPFRHLKRATKPLFAARKGAVFSLGLRGSLVAAGAGAATLEVDRVRQYPGGRWLDIDTRELELTVPLGADVAPSLVQLGGRDAAGSQEAGRGRGVHAEGERDARGDRRRAGRARARSRCARRRRR